MKLTLSQVFHPESEYRDGEQITSLVRSLASCIMQSRTSNLRYLTLKRLLLTFFISNWKYIHSPFFLPPHICLYIFVSEYLRCDRSVCFHLRIYDPTLDRTDKKTFKNVYLCSVGVDPWDSRVLSAAFRPRLRVLTLSFFSAVALDCVEIAFYPSLNPAALRRC